MPSPVAVSWNGVYRGRKLTQPALVVDASQTALGQAAVLDAATKLLDLIDLQASRDGANPNPYDPTTGGKLLP